MEPVNAVVKLDWRDGIAAIVIDSPPVNALGLPVREGIVAAAKTAIEGGARAIVLACQGRTFCAGADIAEFGKPQQAPSLSDVEDALENAPVPVVAAIHGTALGGGLELALACHYRLAAKSAQVGLPEVNLGLLPGAGGTQRVPRIAGIEATLELIQSGRPIAAGRALEMGLVDALVEDEDLFDAAFDFARDREAQGSALPRIRDRAVADAPEEAAAAAARYRERNARQFIGFKAPGNIEKAVLAAAELPFDAGLLREQDLFQELLESDESAAQIYAFFSERAVAKIPDFDKSVAPRPIGRTAVIGAGTMGTGISLALLSAGFPVLIVDLQEEALAKARSRISKTLDGLVAKGRISSEAAQGQLANLAMSSDIGACADADLIVEAVFERMDLKKAVFRQIDEVAKPGAILATNTSYLDIDEIAAVTSRPGDVIGLHFFAPANIMRLLEIVRTASVNPDVLATAVWLARKLGKLGVVSGVCEGFIANRLMARRGEAADRLILEGPAPEHVDRVLRDYGFPMGNYEMLDLVGVDVVGWDRENSAGRTVQEILCEAGHWGQKTGTGYYEHSGDGPRPSRAAREAIETIRARSGIEARTYTDEELLCELLDPVVNEGAKLVEEGIVYRASDIDMALIAGYGWPVYRGGPMFWGDTVGLVGIVKRLKARIARGENLALSPLLESLAAKGERFVRGIGEEG